MFVQTQKTPNPDSLKFLPGRKVSNAGSFEISKKDNFNNVLVKNILSINGVESIFLGSDFVSINKNKDIDWEDIKHIAISFINEFYEDGNEYIINHSKNENEDENLDEIEKKIIHVLETKVKPAVANAIFNATGARVRSWTITAEKVKAAMKGA